MVDIIYNQSSWIELIWSLILRQCILLGNDNGCSIILIEQLVLCPQLLRPRTIMNQSHVFLKVIMTISAEDYK